MFNRIKRILTINKKQPLQVVIDDEEGLLLVKLIVKNKIEAKMNCFWKDETEIYIGDIIIKNDRKINHGYGSLMMSKLIQYAEEKNISKITGQLSRIDDNHKDRLYHFYTKFGFEINEIPESLDDNLMYANIIKKIS